MHCEYPTGNQLPQLRRLWQLAFGDSEAFIGRFFSSGFSPSRCRCIVLDDQVAAALYWFDVSCEGRPFAYLYAVATHPDYQNRGLCRKLMEDTHALLTQRGYDGTLLVPAGDSLRKMYGKMGYRDCGSVSEFVCKAGTPCPVRPVSKEEYALLRRQHLPAGGVLQEGASLAYLETYAQFWTGRDFLLASAADGERLYAMELLGDPSAAPGILAALGYDQGLFRTPGGDVPFAMFHPLQPNVRQPDYFGLAFD